MKNVDLLLGNVQEASTTPPAIVTVNITGDHASVSKAIGKLAKKGVKPSAPKPDHKPEPDLPGEKELNLPNKLHKAGPLKKAPASEKTPFESMTAADLVNKLLS